jgi:DNA segregation ATPase FtsK/SpoIIIE-like protein
MLKTLKQQQIEREEAKKESDLYRIKKQIELDDLKRILENNIKKDVITNNEKNVDNITVFETITKHHNINLTISQYKQKNELFFPYKSYYFNYLYNKYDTIAKKVINQYKTYEGLTDEQYQEKKQEFDILANNHKIKKKTSSLTYSLLAIFFKIK